MPYYPLIRDYSRRFAGRGASADDLAHSTFVNAYRGPASGSVPRDTLAWLRSIARHVGYDRA